MKPKPFVALNHFTVPVAICHLQDTQKRVRLHDLRASLIRVQRCLGEWSRFRRGQQARATVRTSPIYGHLGKIQGAGPIHIWAPCVMRKDSEQMNSYWTRKGARSWNVVAN